jgi:hypothetical protein
MKPYDGFLFLFYNIMIRGGDRVNILYIPQLSMYDKQTGKFLPEADGNINMMRNFINEWSKYRKDDYFYILLPSIIHDWVDGITANRTKVYYNDFVTSARTNRFNFPMTELHQIIGHYMNKIDLVICDVPELARNIKAMFSVLFGYEPKIISNIRHVDDPSQLKSSYDYTLRLADGIAASDVCTILSESMEDILITELDKYLKGSYNDEIMSKVHVFEPSVRAADLVQDFKMWWKTKLVITFPGRLSKGEEKRTNWDKFQTAILELRKQRQDFIVYLTDPSNSMTQELKDNIKDWIFTIEKNRNKYLELLYNTDIIVSLMDIQGFGGISIREAIQFGSLPIIPYKHEYIKMQDKNYMGFLDEVTIEELVGRLNWALEIGTDKFNAKRQMEIAKQFTIEEQMPKLLEKLGGILNG